jgi:hypothetical protein
MNQKCSSCGSAIRRAYSTLGFSAAAIEHACRTCGACLRVIDFIRLAAPGSDTVARQRATATDPGRNGYQSVALLRYDGATFVMAGKQNENERYGADQLR